MPLKVKGLFKLYKINRNVRRGINNANKKVAMIVKDVAIAEYKKKRITTKMPSLIINNIQYTVTIGTETDFYAKVFSDAPHGIFLEFDRQLRNKKSWSSVNPKAPYLFMKAGRDAGASIAPSIIREELTKTKALS